MSGLVTCANASGNVSKTYEIAMYSHNGLSNTATTCDLEGLLKVILNLEICLYVAY